MCVGRAGSYFLNWDYNRVIVNIPIICSYKGILIVG